MKGCDADGGTVFLILTTERPAARAVRAESWWIISGHGTFYDIGLRPAGPCWQHESQSKHCSARKQQQGGRWPDVCQEKGGETETFASSKWMMVLTRCGLREAGVSNGQGNENRTTPSLNSGCCSLFWHSLFPAAAPLSWGSG